MTDTDLLPCRTCSFCLKDVTEIRALVAISSQQNICDECVDLCVHMLRGGDQQTPVNLGMYSLLKEVEQLSTPSSTRANERGDCCIPDAGEPSFVLLGRDKQAPALVDQWASDREKERPDSPKPAMAREIAKRMREYSRTQHTPQPSPQCTGEYDCKCLFHPGDADDLKSAIDKYTEPGKFSDGYGHTELEDDVAYDLIRSAAIAHLAAINPSPQSEMVAVPKEVLRTVLDVLQIDPDPPDYIGARYREAYKTLQPYTKGQ